MSTDEMFDYILDFIECHDQLAYRKKIKGYRLAFNIRDKHYRIPEETLKSGLKIRSKQSAEEIKQKVAEMKQNREAEAKGKQLLEILKYKKNRNMLKKMHERLRQEKYATGGDIESSYLNLKNKAKGFDSQHAKVNLEVLKQMHYSDINMGDDDDFKPEYIIDEDDDSEDSILEMYGQQTETKVELPQENTVAADNNPKDQFDEKVVHIKHQIKDAKNVTSSRENNQALVKLREVNKSMHNPTEKTMLAKYRQGRNVSQVASKNILKNSYNAYPPTDKKLRQNNSVSKISQSVDHNPAKRYNAASLIAPSNKVMVSKREHVTIDLKGKNPKLAQIGGDQKTPSKYPVSLKTGKLRHDRNLGTYNGKLDKNRTERGKHSATHLEQIFKILSIIYYYFK